MNNHTLKKLLDKRKTSTLLEEFLTITPDCEVCWVVDDKGKCPFGAPEKTKKNFHGFVEKIVHSGQTIITSFPSIPSRFNPVKVANVVAIPVL